MLMLSWLFVKNDHSWSELILHVEEGFETFACDACEIQVYVNLAWDKFQQQFCLGVVLVATLLDDLILIVTCHTDAP
jgi:hypothetical protein